ncbi:class I SAM-dependent methyltransferase [Streptosporangium sp. NPDC051022]|uniref:class I SAM-dependent DNA methyltransferase n=1 Tax=Streptosporangium sp. NPDC051022 TaxID=3155752 RepID=UPI003438AE9F
MSNLVAHWDRRAESHDETPGNSLTAEQTEAWKSLLAEVYPIRSGRLLDIGCGTGTYSLLLAELGFDVHGVDTSRRMIAHARRKALGRGGPGGGLTATFSTLAAQDVDGRYDAVFSRNVLWTVENPGRLADVVREHTTESALWVAVETIWDGRPHGAYREVGKSLPGFGGWHPNVLRDVFARHGFARTTWSSISNRAELVTADKDVHVLFRVSR